MPFKKYQNNLFLCIQTHVTLITIVVLLHLCHNFIMILYQIESCVIWERFDESKNPKIQENSSFLLPLCLFHIKHANQESCGLIPQNKKLSFFFQTSNPYQACQPRIMWFNTPKQETILFLSNIKSFLEVWGMRFWCYPITICNPLFALNAPHGQDYWIMIVDITNKDSIEDNMHCLVVIQTDGTIHCCFVIRKFLLGNVSWQNVSL